MEDSWDLITLSIRRYNEPMWGLRKMGPARYALDCWKASLIIELWWLR